jgi:hypothetical protein
MYALRALSLHEGATSAIRCFLQPCWEASGLWRACTGQDDLCPPMPQRRHRHAHTGTNPSRQWDELAELSAMKPPGSLVLGASAAPNRRVRDVPGGRVTMDRGHWAAAGPLRPQLSSATFDLPAHSARRDGPHWRAHTPQVPGAPRSSSTPAASTMVQQRPISGGAGGDMVVPGRGSLITYPYPIPAPFADREVGWGVTMSFHTIVSPRLDFRALAPAAVPPIVQEGGASCASITRSTVLLSLRSLVLAS